ncbi:MAG: 3-oxoacyl-ACP reductase [Chloroflexi bacterium]|nr:3-oxoacyl-ACP reductase [Chloroflexota bacterium]|tara:strand:- start:215 stop:943 length:729 start_codon:yes stop_codon:yes gene_type:complete
MNRKKRVFITGASRGIGKSIAEKFIQSDFEVFIGFKDKKIEAEELASTGNAYAINIDVSSTLSVNAAFDEIESSHGSIDILINNAGISQVKLFEELEDDDWFNMLSVNLIGAFRCSQRAVIKMRENKFGKIINISSLGGQWGGIHQVHYAASKAALINLTKSMAKKFSNEGICTNAIAPGLIETDMTKDELSSINLEELESQIPLGRLGDPSDVASLAFFLAEDGNYITGQTLNINGGIYFS